MSDEAIRKLQQLYLKDDMSIDIFLHVLGRHGVKPVWDWVAGGLKFYNLPLKKKVEIFLEKWPSDFQNSEPTLFYSMLDATIKRGNSVYWIETHDDAPSVGEILSETLGDLAYYYGIRKAPAPWVESFSNFIADEVYSAQCYVAVLQHYQVL